VFLHHFHDYSKEIIEDFGLTSSDLVVEIGSNDGSLLEFFQRRCIPVLGVDPAIEISQKANESGIETICSFFDTSTVKRILSEKKKAKVVIANNVFAHVPDLVDFSNNVNSLLTNDGVFVFEVSYLGDVVENTLFDTIYHEHLDYHHIGPFVHLFPKLGLELFKVKRVGTHGGSIRCFVGKVGKRPIDRSVAEMLKQEYLTGLPTVGGMSGNQSVLWNVFQNRFSSLKVKVSEKLDEIKKSGHRLCGYGAPAKLTTFMYGFGMSKDDVEFIVDNSKWKQGLFTPGHHIPVHHPDELLKENSPKNSVIFAWNFADAIIANNAQYLRAGGKFIVPIPFREVTK
jgi:SAM-dependent methyltransferase